jgi:hypothetical protein
MSTKIQTLQDTVNKLEKQFTATINIINKIQVNKQIIKNNKTQVEELEERMNQQMNALKTELIVEIEHQTRTGTEKKGRIVKWTNND